MASVGSSTLPHIHPLASLHIPTKCFPQNLGKEPVSQKTAVLLLYDPQILKGTEKSIRKIWKKREELWGRGSEETAENLT